jgi:hypothetical protein
VGRRGLAFGLSGAARSGVPDLLAVAEAVRFSPVALITFGVGPIALAAGWLWLDVALWRTRIRESVPVG